MSHQRNNMHPQVPAPVITSPSSGSSRHRMKTPASLQKVGKFAGRAGTLGKKVTTGFWTDFVAFVGKGNIVSLAIAFIVGNMFQLIITSLVTDIITPIIGLGPSINFDDAFVILKRNATAPATKYSTSQDAKNSGAVVMTYGHFFTVLINFIIVAIFLFILIKIITSLIKKKKEEEPKPTCPSCKCEIKEGAKKCQWCTADIPGEDDVSSDDGKASSYETRYMEDKYARS